MEKFRRNCTDICISLCETFPSPGMGMLSLWMVRETDNMVRGRRSGMYAVGQNGNGILPLNEEKGGNRATDKTYPFVATDVLPLLLLLLTLPLHH